MDKFDILKNKAIDFRDKRDWKQFHTPKDMSISIAIEAAELMECFQWKNAETLKQYLSSEKSKNVSKEMADILIYLITMAHDLNIDLIEEALMKIDENDKKYPISKSKGNATKYKEL